MAHLTRRELIHTGAAGVALLALANCAPRNGGAPPPFDDPHYDYRQLTSGDRTLVAAVSQAMLLGALPGAAPAHAGALVEVVRGVDVAVNGLQPAIQAEVHQLFGLLQFPVTRVLTAGVWGSWSDTDPGDVAAFLTRWRFSNVALFRTGYQALHQLVMASWYGNNASWSRIGYPGPPVVA